MPSAAAGTGLGNYTINYVNGTLTVSALEITPLNSFGTVNLNGVGLQLITLTNKGTTGFTISGLSITAPGNALADYLTANLSLCPPMIEKLPATLPAGKRLHDWRGHTSHCGHLQPNGLNRHTHDC